MKDMQMMQISATTANIYVEEKRKKLDYCTAKGNFGGLSNKLASNRSASHTRLSPIRDINTNTSVGSSILPANLRPG